MNCFADLLEGNPRAAHLNGLVQRLFGHLDKALRLIRGFPHNKRPRGVPMMPIKVYGDIHVDNVAILNHGGVRDAVADALIQGCAHTLGKATVVEWRRVCAIVDYHLVNGDVNIVGGDSRLYQGPSIVQNFLSEFPGSPHFFDALFVVDFVFFRVGWVLLRLCVRGKIDIKWHEGGRRKLPLDKPFTHFPTWLLGSLTRGK
mmetsp:Transcript_6888/g.13920  ORF Transcript_6888/g.13920 Transcript_6888/m.13920 type:complete len:201 (-) Transcript_6888:314-916(-)